MIPYAKQSIDKQDIKEVVSVLKSEMITQGPVVPRFEKLISSYVSSKYAIATNSATSALHIACLSSISFLYNRITLPLDPITLPYLTTENKVVPPVRLLPETNILSEANFVAP